LVLAAALIAGGLVLPAALAWIGTLSSQWPLHWQDLQRLINGYVLIFLGSGAHLAIEAVKSAKAETKPSFQAMNDWILWLHVRQTPVLWGIAYVWLGYVLLSVGMPKLDWSAAFFAGYSIDSVTEVLLDRFQTTIKVKTQALVAVTK